jgi:flagellar biosynthesis protein FlhG
VSADQAQRLRELAKAADVKPSAGQPRKTSNSGCTSIAVTSGKGGVGKTTLSLTLAASLARLQKRVLMMDVDLGLANVHILLGIAPRYNISHVIAGECSIDQVVVEAAPGVYLVPGASGLEELANLDTARLERLRMAFMGLEDNYDYLLMDTGAGIGSAMTHFVKNSDLALLVMTPDPSSLADSYAMVKVLYEKGNVRVAVVVNMVSSEREGRETFDRLNTLVVRFLKKPVELYAILPADKEVHRLGRRQIQLADRGANSRFYDIASDLAKKISGYGASAGAAGGKSGFFSRFFGLSER